MNRARKAQAFVLAQVILLIGLVVIPVVSSVNFQAPPALYFAAMTGVLGACLFGYSAFGLGKSLTPSPIPNSHGLVTTGPYKFVRHPVYTGLILITFSWSFALQSQLAFLLSIALYILLTFKSNFEEQMLVEMFGHEYLDYRQKTARFFPTYHLLKSSM